MGIESEPSRTELLEKVVEMRERGERWEGSMRREHVHAGRGIKRRNWGSK